MSACQLIKALRSLVSYSAFFEAFFLVPNRWDYYHYVKDFDGLFCLLSGYSNCKFWLVLGEVLILPFIPG